MVYAKDYVYVVCRSVAKWRDRKTPCTQRKKNLENDGIAPPSKLPQPTLPKNDCTETSSVMNWDETIKGVARI